MSNNESGARALKSSDRSSRLHVAYIRNVCLIDQFVKRVGPNLHFEFCFIAAVSN